MATDAAEVSLFSRPLQLKRGPVFATFALLALAYAFAAGPFRSPDEYNHFFRSYHISEGKILARRAPAGLFGDYLPASLMRVATTSAGFPEVPPARTTSDQIKTAWEMASEDGRTFTHFPGSALYSPLAYLPSALGIALGRAAHAPPFALLYLGRICNALTGAILITCAVRSLPAGLKSIATIALFPTWLFQTATLNPDAVTLGLTLLWVALLLRARAHPAPLSARDGAQFFALAACISQLRPPFPFVALLVWIVPHERFTSRKHAVFFCLSVILATAAPSVLWNALVLPMQVQMRPDVITEPWRQLAAGLWEPARIFSLVASDLWHNCGRYWQELIGTFSWLEVRLPAWLLLVFTVSTIAGISACETKHCRLTAKLRGLCLAAAATGVLLTELLIYMNWNAVAAPRIEGFQGRYLLPCLVLLVVGSANGLLVRHARRVMIFVIAVCLAANLLALTILARATWW